VEDSAEFKRAIAQAAEVLHLNGFTPRDCKRFINKLRFRAMQCRVAAAQFDEAGLVADAVGAEIKARKGILSGDK
jgi:hypothetical protein